MPVTLLGELSVRPGVAAAALRGSVWAIWPGQRNRSIVGFDLTDPACRVATRLRPTRISVHGEAVTALDYALCRDLDHVAQRFGQHEFSGWIELVGTLARRYTISRGQVVTQPGYMRDGVVVWSS